MTRYFKVVGDAGTHGRYCGETPQQAAAKAFSVLTKEQKKSKFNFELIECTQNSKHKTYSYSGERQKLDVPIKREVKDGTGKVRTIEIKFANKIRKL